MSILDDLKQVVHTCPGVMGVYAKRLNGSGTVAVNADSPFYLASTTKVLILAALVDIWPNNSSGNLRNTLVPMSLLDYRQEGYAFTDRHIGRDIPMSDVMRAMLLNSDAAATDMIVRTIGARAVPGTGNPHHHGMLYINQMVGQLGIPNIGQITTMAYLDRYTYGLRDDRWAVLPNYALEAKRRSRIDDYIEQLRLPVPRYDGDFDDVFQLYRRSGMNHATPRAMVTVLERIAQKTLLGDLAKNQLLFDEYRLAAEEGLIGPAVPDACVVDAKGGAHHRVICSVGFVADSSGNPEAAIGVFTQNLEIPRSDSYAIIRRAANLAWRALGFSHTMPAPALSGSAAQLVFTAPGIGEFFESGQKPTIRWLSGNLTGRLTLKLVRTNQDGDETELRTLSTNAIDDGEWHSFIVDNSLPPGTNYRLKLSSNNQPSVVAYSNYFTLHGVIRVLEPHLGEVHLYGEKPKIRWTSFGLSGRLTLDAMKRNDDLDPVQNIFGFTQQERISSVAIDDGEWHSWTVSTNDLGFNAATIRVRSNTESGVEVESEPFVLGGIVDVTFPTAESILDISSRPTLRWTSHGNLGRLRIELWRGQGKKILTISDNAIDDGEWHSWTVPASLADGYGYQIRIYSKDHGTLVGFSDLFQIGAVLEWIVPSLVQDNFAGALSGPNSRPSFFPRGTQPTLRWQTKGDLPGNLRIDLMLGHFRAASIATNALNDGEWHSWTVPSNLAPCSDYQLRLQSLDRPGVQVYSHRFHIGQMIDLWVERDSYARPSSGGAGPVPDIRWRTQGLASDTRLTLKLVPKGGSAQVISTNVLNDGEWHSYRIGSSMKRGDYRFRLHSNEDPGVYGFSSYFKVS